MEELTTEQKAEAFELLMSFTRKEWNATLNEYTLTLELPTTVVARGETELEALLATLGRHKALMR